MKLEKIFPNLSGDRLKRLQHDMQRFMKYFAARNAVCYDPACVERQCVEERRKRAEVSIQVTR